MAAGREFQAAGPQTAKRGEANMCTGDQVHFFCCGGKSIQMNP